MEITCRVYRPRKPRESPLYQLVEGHLEKLLRVWPTRFVRSKAARQDAAVNVKRVQTYALADYAAASAQGLDFIRPTVEIKTTWHPVGW